MRYFIGIDISKFKHTAAVIDQDGVVHIEPFDFDKLTSSGSILFLLLFLPFIQDDFIIGMEDTGHYADNLQKFLLSKDLSCHVQSIGYQSHPFSLQSG